MRSPGTSYTWRLFLVYAEQMDLLVRTCQAAGLPRIISSRESVGETIAAFHTSRLDDVLGLEFADNTILFIRARPLSYPDDCDAEIDTIDDLSSDEAYGALLSLLEQKAPERYKEIQKPLDEIAARKHREKEERLERADYERLNAKFEGVR
jgi:hypothetical protein